MIAAARLSKSFVTPQRIASVLDWKQVGGAVMAFDLTGTEIGVAIATRPSQEGTTMHTLEPIQLVESQRAAKKKSSIDDDVVDQLERLVKEHKVCAFVVGWPLQREGRPGKPCGKVLHLLDQLTERKKSMLSKNRPFTLWDDRRIPRGGDSDGDFAALAVDEEEAPDSWGRSVAFSGTPTTLPGPDEVCSSQDRYHRPAARDSTGACSILRHFMGSFWEPNELEEEQPVRRAANKSCSPAQEKKLFDSFEEYNDDKVCIKEALL